MNGLAAILGALNEVKNGRFALNKDLELLGRVSSSLFLKTSWKHPC